MNNKKWYDNEISQGIMKKKYFHECETTAIEMFDRICSIYSDKTKKQLYRALTNGEFCPAGRILYGAGSKGKFKATTSNCFILPAPKEDSIEGIFNLTREMGRTFSYGGGVGITISTLRPKDSKTNNSAKTSTGAVSFLNILNEVGNVIGSNGRRSATMIGLDCSHPDLYEFLRIKENNAKLESMNISILFTDEFMQAVRDNKEYTLKFDIPETGEKIRKVINAKDFFNEFCKVNWNYGDPGCLFKNRIRSYNLLSGYKDYIIKISNPCGEVLGNDYNSCLLSSINLYEIVNNKFSDKADINWGKLDDLVRMGINVLDETLDYGLDSLPLKENKKCATDWRAIGLGTLGMADMLIALGLKYGSREAIDKLSEIFDFINITALDESCNLAKEKGTFDKYNWDYTKESLLIKSLIGGNDSLYEKIKQHGLRNGSLLSIAPTGSISLLLGGLSGGVEPLFKISYERSTHSMEKENKKFRVFAKSVRELLEYNNLPLDTSDTDIKKRFPFIIESHDIKPIDRILTQAVMQEYVDNAISSTVNLDNSATPNDIFEIYTKAWEQGLKGITVFRDGCKRGNILGVTDKKDNKIVFDSIVPEKRRKIKKVNGNTYKKETSCVPSMYVTVNRNDAGDIFEMFTATSSGCKSNIGTITRLVSYALRSGSSVKGIINELKENKCEACQLLRRKGNKEISSSCGNAIAEALEEEYNNGKEVKEVNTDGLMKCPECGKYSLKLDGHCQTCQECSWSTCN